MASIAFLTLSICCFLIRLYFWETFIFNLQRLILIFYFSFSNKSRSIHLDMI
eukprot:UN13392